MTEALVVLRWLGWRGVLALALLLALAAQTMRLSAAQASIAAADARYAHEVLEAARARLGRAEAVRKFEHERAESVRRIMDAYEKGKLNAKLTGEAVAADLRAGTLRLRKLWQGCEARSGAAVSGPAASAAERDAGADDRAAAAGRIVRIGAEADAQLRACQAIVEDDRRLMPSR